MTNEGQEMGRSAPLSVPFQEPAVLPESFLAAAGGEASWKAAAVGPVGAHPLGGRGREGAR